MNSDSGVPITPVVIVGAGPVGLALALDLSWRGIRSTLVEQASDQRGSIDANPRAAAISPRTMEFCRRWGFASRIRNAGFPRDFNFNIVFCTSLDGYLITTQYFPSMNDRAPIPVSPEFRERCPQTWFDPILSEELARYRQVTLLAGWRLESFENSGESVKVTIRDVEAGVTRQLTARYLVACDGPASSIRSALDIPTEGPGNLSDSLNVVLRIPGFLSKHDKGSAERYIFLDEKGRWAELSCIDGRDRWRFGITWADTALAGDQDRLNELISRALGPNMEYQKLSVVRWRRRDAIAAQYRVKNVFLAGDAAHVIPPNLGLGMNTGVGDSVDLGWKLAATLGGWGGSHLLDSYQAERRPVALRNAAASTFAYQVGKSATAGHPEVVEPGERGERGRAAVGRGIQEKLPAGWQTLNLQMGYRYDDSPICVPDGTPTPEGDEKTGVYVQTARPGARAPHVWLKEGVSILDIFGRGFVLLRFAPQLNVSRLADAARARQVPLQVVDLGSEEAYKAYGARLVLVRPDGHVAWRGDTVPEDAQNLVDIVRGAHQRSGGSIPPGAAAN